MNTGRPDDGLARVLLVEDNPRDAILVRKKLEEERQPLSLQVRASLAEALAALAEAPPDLILLDLGLPDSSGLETFERMHDAASETPIIVLTNRNDMALASACFECGAHQFLVKDMVEGSIAGAVFNTLARARAQADLVELHDSIRRTVADSQDATLVLSHRGTVKFANQAAYDLFGDRAAEGRQIGLPLDAIGPQEFDVPRGDGSACSVEMRVGEWPWYGESALVVTLRDVSERNEVRDRLEHFNRVLHAIRSINHLIVRERNPETLIREAAEILVEAGGFESVWIVLGDGSAGTSAAAHAERSTARGPATVRSLERAWPPCAAAALSDPDDALVLDHGACDPCPFGRDCGNGDSAVLPLRHRGSVFGLLGVALPRNVSVDDEETSLVKEIAGDIALALWEIGTEVQRSEDEARFRMLFESMAQGVVLHDATGQIVDANPAAEQILGLARDQILGRTWTDPRWQTVREDSSHLPGDEHPAMVAHRTGRPSEAMMGVFNPAQEQTRWIAVHASPESATPTQSPGRVFTTFEDVTELRSAEQHIRESETFLHNLLDAIPIPVFYKDMEGRYLGFNSAFEEFFGDTRERMVGRTVFELNPSDLAATYHAKDLDLLERGGSQQYESRVRDARGDEHDVVFHKAVFADSDGATAGLIGAILDVTDLKGIEEALRQSQKMEAIGRLAGGVAHDFNNQLQTISMYCDLALDELREGDPLTECITEISTAARRSARLTRQLLAFGRRQSLAPRVLSPSRLLADLENMLRRTVGEDVEVEMSLAEDCASIRVDPGQLEQVIISLVVNSRDAMPSGGRLRIEAGNVEADELDPVERADLAPGAYVMIRVCDTGCGMDEEAQEHIFEPFFTTKERGTGLGLATVHGVVRQSGGQILCRSMPGVGSTFTIYLPQVDEALSESAEAGLAQIRRGSETILVAEDEDALRAAMKASLEKLGYTVLAAENGGEALHKCGKTKSPIDLLVTDLVMPVMSGMELAEELARIKPGLKVLFVSGYASDVIDRHGPLAPGSHFLQKPFPLKALASRIREVLDDD